MKHLISLTESLELKDNIDTLNHMGDVFNFLNDIDYIQIGVFFIQRIHSEYSDTIMRKYNTGGDLVQQTRSPREKFGPNQKEEIWLLTADGMIKPEEIIDLCQEITKSIRMAENMLYLENLGSKSTIGIWGANGLNSFYFDDIDEPMSTSDGRTQKEILEDRLTNLSKFKFVRTSISIQFRKQSDGF